MPSNFTPIDILCTEYLLIASFTLKRWIEGKDHLPWSAGGARPNAVQPAFFAPGVNFWLLFNPVFTTVPKLFSAKLLSSQSITSMSRCMGLFMLKGRTFCFPLLYFMGFLSAQISSLLRFLWMTVQPLVVSASSPNFMLYENSLKGATWRGALSYHQDISEDVKQYLHPYGA